MILLKTSLIFQLCFYLENTSKSLLFIFYVQYVLDKDKILIIMSFLLPVFDVFFSFVFIIDINYVDFCNKKYRV